jgi:hypothetical protein
MELGKFKGNILTKAPFKRIVPFGGYTNGMETSIFSYPIIEDGKEIDMTKYERPYYQLIPQSEFMREYFSSGHKINSPAYYPDKRTMIELPNGTKSWATERVARYSSPFQYVITTKQLVHLCGNNIQLRNSNISPDDEQKMTLAEFKQGWLDKNMEVAWYNCAKSEKITGDAAVAFYYQLINGKVSLRWRTFSYIDGDILFDHVLPSGDRIFARKYMRINDDQEVVSCVEVWDSETTYRFVQSGKTSEKNPFKDIGLDDYTLEESMEHGFSRCPVVYKKNLHGACWSMSQDNIDAYEISVSQLMENNKAFAFPILFLRSQDAEIEGMADGRPFAIRATGDNDDARLLTKGDASASFTLQLETQLKNIFLGSFTVTPPEVRSGDLPGVAIKLIYSPALEKAMSDAMDWDLFIDDMVELFKEGYGREMKATSSFNKIHVKGSIVPYVHENVAELMNVLCQGVISGALSIESAASVVPFGEKDEFMRLMEQKRMELIGEKRENTTFDDIKDMQTREGLKNNPSNMAKKTNAEIKKQS